MYSNQATDEAKIDSEKFESELIGRNDLGCVHIHGPFGNVDSEVKIAYLIGMHPLESKSHRALFDTLTNVDNLNFTYYIYNISVFNSNSDSEGRMEGQLLAKEFVAPDIINEKYDLFLDIHSNRGSTGPGEYEITNFLFAPGFDEKSTEIMNKLIDEIKDIVYYAPEHRTSPPFITELTANEGIATLVYECYTYEQYDVTLRLADELVYSVDNLTIF